MLTKHQKWVYPDIPIRRKECFELFITPEQLRAAADFLEKEAELTLGGEHVPEVIFSSIVEDCGDYREIRLLYQQA